MTLKRFKVTNWKAVEGTAHIFAFLALQRHLFSLLAINLENMYKMPCARKICSKRLSSVNLTSLNLLSCLHRAFPPPGYFQPTSFKKHHLFTS